LVFGGKYRTVSVSNTDNNSEVTFKNKFAVTRMRMWTHLRMRRRRRTGGWWRTTRKARKKVITDVVGSADPSPLNLDPGFLVNLDPVRT
jgi:hypothetical protein